MPKRKIQSFLVELAAWDWFRFPQPPYRGKKWQIRFISAKEDSNDKVRVRVRVDGRSCRPKQVVIRAEDEKTAQRALNLVLGAFNVVLGEYFFPVSGTVVPRLYVSGLSPSERFQFGDGPPRVSSTSNIPLACMIAARTSLSLQHIYALAKLSLSIETCSVPVMELDPAHGDNLPKSVFPEEHVRMAFAIANSIWMHRGTRTRNQSKRKTSEQVEWQLESCCKNRFGTKIEERGNKSQRALLVEC
jgi:hypothetical protein